MTARRGRGGRGEHRVAVVTGGGGGIGAGIAQALGRAGAHVVTVDPLVSLDGTAQLPPPDETTAGRIVAAGGSAQASSASVTDASAVRTLFEELVAEHGAIDAVVNVAGISRPTSFTEGDDGDWRAVIEVHLDGYLNVLAAALPLMAETGRGRILGVTSGAAWRAGDAGAYGCAKRAVASLTWQLGRCPPEGVTVNAISPIAMTRMVTAAIERVRAATPGKPSASGGLGFGGMPRPDDLGPLAAHLVDDALSWCSGHVVFAAGSEIALVEPPRLLEVVRTSDVASVDNVVETAIERAFVAAEAAQATGGGSNPRFGALFDEGRPAAGGVGTGAVTSCLVVTDVPALGAAVTAALDARGVPCTSLDATRVAPGIRGAADALAAAGPSVDAVVVALAGAPPASGSTNAWTRVLGEHEGIVGQLHADAAWARAIADRASAQGPMRLVTLTDARTAGGRSRAEAVAQLARASRGATGDRVAAFAVSVESAAERAATAAGALVAHLLASPEGVLSGAELVCGDGWLGLRGHPRPTGSVAFGGPEVPVWFDTVLRQIVGAGKEER